MDRDDAFISSIRSNSGFPGVEKGDIDPDLFTETKNPRLMVNELQVDDTKDAVAPIRA